MAFDNDLTTATGKVRLEVGDTLFEDGPRPDGRNFSDEELAYFLTQEGDHILRTAARVFEVLAHEWARYPVQYALGPERTNYEAAEGYRKQAAALRARYGYGQGGRETQSGALQVQVYPGDGVSQVYG